MQRLLWWVADFPIHANRQRRPILEQFYYSPTPTSVIKGADIGIPILADSHLKYLAVITPVGADCGIALAVLILGIEIGRSAIPALPPQPRSAVALTAVQNPLHVPVLFPQLAQASDSQCAGQRQKCLQGSLERGDL